MSIKLIDDNSLLQRCHLPLTHWNIKWILWFLWLELLLYILLLKCLVQTEDIPRLSWGLSSRLLSFFLKAKFTFIWWKSLLDRERQWSQLVIHSWLRVTWSLIIGLKLLEINFPFCTFDTVWNTQVSEVWFELAWYGAIHTYWIPTSILPLWLKFNVDLKVNILVFSFLLMILLRNQGQVVVEVLFNMLGKYWGRCPSYFVLL